jgi:transposase
VFVLHAGLDLGRRKVDVCLLSDDGEIVDEWASPRDADGLRGLARRAGMHAAGVRGVIESMNGARFVHDTLEALGWEVLIADAQRVMGLAPLARKTDRIDARVLARLSCRDLVPAIWLPDPTVRRERELARLRLHLVRHRTSLKNRIHGTLITFGKPCPVSDLFGHAGRELLDRVQIPDPWRRNVDASLALIDDLELQIARLTVELRRMGADHRYVPVLVTAAGFGWINAFTVAYEIGDITRFASAAKLCGSTGLCPRVIQSGASDRRGPISKHGPKHPALGAVRGGHERLHAPALPGALPGNQTPAGPPARTQGRPHRPLPQADRGDLAHAHPQPTVRSGRRHSSSSVVMH